MPIDRYENIPEDNPEFDKKMSEIESLLRENTEESLIRALQLSHDPLFASYFEFTAQELENPGDRVFYLTRMKKVLMLSELYRPESALLETELRILLKRIFEKDLSAFEIKDNPNDYNLLRLLSDTEPNGEILTKLYFKNPKLQLIPKLKLQEIIKKVLETLSPAQQKYLKDMVSFIETLKSS